MDMKQVELHWQGGRLTRKLAVLICRELWKELSLSGGSKHSWSQFEHKGGDVSAALEHDCPCCEYVRRRHAINRANFFADLQRLLCIESCPLRSQWTTGCYYNGSTFSRWATAKRKDDRIGMKRYALIIAKAAGREYRRLGGKQ